MDIDCEHDQILLGLIKEIPDLSDQFKPFLQTANWSIDKRHSLINNLVQQLLQNDSLSSKFYQELQRLFPRYFLAFIQRLHTAVNCSTKITNQISIKQRFLVLLSQILQDYPTLHTITENHLLTGETSLIEWNRSSPKKKLKTKDTSIDDEISLLVATLRLLLLPNSKINLIQSWKWSQLIDLIQNHPNEQIKWLSFLCLSIVFKMSSEEQDLHRPTVSNSTIFTINELLNRNLVTPLNNSIYDRLFLDEDFKKRTIFINGIPLLKYSNEKQSNETVIRLTHTQTMEKSLREIALSISLGWTTFVFSRISNGKTLIIEYLSQQIGKRLIKIQCSDHMDSKILLGTYQCTDKPGEFLWTPGLLVEAISEGHWLLMEDIDAANSDVLTTIKSLIETKSIAEQRISPDFRLFLTQRDTGVPVQSTELIHLLKSVFCVVIPPYSDSEIIQIMENLPIWNNDLQLFQMKLFELYQSFQTTKSSHQTRLVTLRDLLKCCHRLSSLSISKSIDRQLAFHDIVDCFASFLPKANRLSIIQTIGTLFNMNNQEAEFYSFKSTPDFNEQNKQFFGIGHVQLPIQEKNLSNLNQFCFAKTRTAMFTLERIARCVQMNEPVLLSGETGCGKTTLVQYLAEKTGNRLHVINLSQQSDAVDLLGGYKPFDPILLLKQLYREFCVEQISNEAIEQVQKSIQAKRYKESVKLMIKYTDETSNLKGQLIKLRESLKNNQKSALIFRFVEGSLVQALRNGHWILLDEINLASSETLQLLSGILESQQGTIWLAERGDKLPIVRHPNFRLFGCMNPASDVGKRDIPIGIRNRFTEFYVDESDDRSEYLIIVDKYLNQTNIPKEYIDRIVNFYIEIQNKVKNFLLTSSSTSNNRITVNYSLRTLCRSLRYIATTQWTGKSYSRALYEGFCLSFFSQLDRSYYHDVEKLIHQLILGGKPELNVLLKNSQMFVSKENAKKYIELKTYLILKGEQTAKIDENYIFTKTVDENLLNIIRVLSSKSYPVLLQGETSVGKTSLIHWLAAATGNQCVRINNHEHTDLSEYLGTYTCSSQTGQLKFEDGPLIKAMRYGWWIILDELNLASTDILEALNRLLDDNRQLFLTETNELINAHERFQLFATQNPAGEQYAGRKRLSKAFRNRFIELHFDNLPENELEIIIEKKCQLPKSYSKLLIKTMNDLQKYRSQKGVFFGKSSLITLRDLFRWALRYTKYKDSCENFKQFLGEHGYLLLAGKSRNEQDRLFIKLTIEKYFCEKNSSIDEEILFGDEGSRFSTSRIWKQIRTNNHLKHIVWTRPLRRFAILAALAIDFDEPVLLVGETGCGKTTICQILSEINHQKLYTVNCHTTTESADFLGSIRPVRHEENNSGLFEWQDGALVTAMKQGDLFLIDEISLADDSVLERLNSVLEPEKQLVLAEKGYQENEEQIQIIKAHSTFRLVATMNPGGDFGKKELSPALRNRFTEIWCTPTETIDDFYAIIFHNLNLTDENDRQLCSKSMCEFIDFIRTNSTNKRILITVRDILSWISFINLNLNNWKYSYEQGAYLVFLDAFDCSSTLKQSAIDFLANQPTHQISDSTQFQIQTNELIFGSYAIPFGPIYSKENIQQEYSFQAPTTLINIERLLRAMQLSSKPILIEGSPGVGKTSLVIALAKLAGYPYIRINLSEQTDISDLFGSDLPDVQSGQTGKFKWHDGPLLTAIKNNHWIILDELNLANQSVLEGLNACLDHRGEIYIPELNRTFSIHEQQQHQSKNPLRIFACQNPYGQVSGRKGLPKSFLNRFTTIYFSNLNRNDLQIICQQLYPNIQLNFIEQILDFNQQLTEEFQQNHWDFNLRDLLKWCQLFDQTSSLIEAFDLIYLKRLRNQRDEEILRNLYQQITNEDLSQKSIQIQFHIDSKFLQIGSTRWKREHLRLTNPSSTHSILLMRNQIEILSSILKCLSLSWPILLIGSSTYAAKSTLIHQLASLTGQHLEIFQLNSSIDTNELLGNYQQLNFEQYARYQLNSLKENLNLNQQNLHDLDFTNQQITVEYLNQLRTIFPSNEIDKLIEKSSQNQHFIWIESILLRSMRQGFWLILENVNTCSLSVLDRLNSLLETNGYLILNEGGGEGQIVKPHRNFRLILTMDPKQGNGEISRPMRNRCCEIFCDLNQSLNYFDLFELIQSLNISQTNLQLDFIQIHQILSQKVSTFGYENLIRSCLLYNEYKRYFANSFKLSIKTAYRTLNSHLNAEIDLLIDEFQSNSVDFQFENCPTKITDLCLQTELILSNKFNLPLWNCSLNEQFRQFQLLFYRFNEHLSMATIEYDYFLARRPNEKYLIDICQEIQPKDNHLLLRILVEFKFLCQNLKTTIQTNFFDEKFFFSSENQQFWISMRDYFLKSLSSSEINSNEDLAFSLYENWRWFYSIINCPSNLITGRLHLIISWPYIRQLFSFHLQENLFVEQIKQIDNEYLQIQNEFLEFYRFYSKENEYLFDSSEQYENVCRRKEIFHQIDLFADNKNPSNLDKYLQFWTENRTEMSNLTELENNWNEFKSISTEFPNEIFFYNTFESIFYFEYQWISEYFFPSKSSINQPSFSIPFDRINKTSDEYFCQLISYSKTPSISRLYAEKFNASESLLHLFNIRSSKILFGFYEQIRRQMEFCSKFLWLNGSFLQCSKSSFEQMVSNCLESKSSSNEICFDLIEQSLNRIELIRPRGQIDPILYEQILNQYQIDLQSDVAFELNLRKDLREKYEYSSNVILHQWEKQMKSIVEKIYQENQQIFRFNNEQYQLLVNYLTKQLIEQLLNRKFLLEEIYEKKQRKIYEQFRKNIVEFHRNLVLDKQFYVYRDVTMPLMKQVFQIILAFDCFFQNEATKTKAKSNLFELCQFPFDVNQLNLFQIAKNLFEKRTFIQQNLPIDKFRQYFMLIFEYLFVYNQINRNRTNDFNEFVENYLETVHFLWSEEQKQIDEETRQSSSIYRHETSQLESEFDEQEYQRLFPSFDSHFQEFLSNEQQLNLEQQQQTEPPVEDKSPILPYSILYEYFSLILNENQLSIDELIVGLFNSIYQFDEDHRLLTDMIYLTLKSKEKLSIYIENLHKPFDIYYDSKPSMIIECFPTIDSIDKRTRFLLETHENHPTLMEILRVIERIQSFSIDNSLIKFLYGFDILFTKLTYWNETYGSRTLQTTFDEQINQLTKILIDFRKFEFQCSSQSLSMIDFNQRKSTIDKWWLHLFALIKQEHDDQTSFEQILHEFFQKSTLGDFRTRLELCRKFSRYFSAKTNNRTLNFIVQYYEQYESFIENHIQSIRKPIQQEINQFVRIQQWKDTNYYALKQAIDKSHKFLFKSMKKYRLNLNQPIQQIFSLYQIQIDSFLQSNDEFSRLIKLKLNKKLVHYQYSSQIQSDTKFINEISSTIDSMKIQSNDRKQIKQLFNEKRQLLTHLFKKLTSIGLSFRKGLLNQQKNFSIQPISIEFFELQLENQIYGTIQTKKNQKLIVNNRSNCLERFEKNFKEIDSIYYRILYQHHQLNIFAQKNRIDPIIYERIQGFSQHLIQIIYQQKSLFHSFFENYRIFSREFSVYSKENYLVSLKNLNEIDRLYSLTISLIERSYSFLLIIQTIPTNSFEQIPILYQLPNYIQADQFQSMKILLDKFLQKLYSLTEKINRFYQFQTEHHFLLKEIDYLHTEISIVKQQIQDVLQKLFIDENQFPNDHFVGDLAKNFIEIYEHFTQIDLLKQNQLDQDSAINIKSFRRYTKRLLTNLFELSEKQPENSSSSPMWLVHFYNFLNSHITQLNLPYLIKITRKSISPKTIVLFQQIHLLVEQILFRFIFYHQSTSKIYLTLSKTFLNLLKDGFQLPPEEEEQDGNDDEKAEGGISGMGDGQVGQNAKDVSDQIETEDQLDEAKMPQQEQDKQDGENSDEQQNVNDEPNGMEVSFDFEAPLDQPADQENEDENENEENESETNDDNIDDQMGDVNEDEQGEIFDENKWGDEDQQKDKDEEKLNQTEKSTGKDQRKQDDLSAKNDQLDLNEDSLDENQQQESNEYQDDQQTANQNEQLNTEDNDLELPENMDLDGNEGNNQEEEEEKEGEENNDVENEENPDEQESQMEMNEQEGEEGEDEQLNEEDLNRKSSLPENLPEDEQKQEDLQESALTQDKNSTNTDENKQFNDLQQSFPNTQTFEQQNSKNQQENLGQSSTQDQSQTQQTSSDQFNQISQQLNQQNQQQNENIDKTSNQSNEQRTLSEILSFIDKNIKAALDIEQSDQQMDNIDDLPALEQQNQQEQTQIYAHAKNIPKDFPQQKQILDSATDEQMKDAHDEDKDQTEPMIIDNQQDPEQDQSSNEKQQKKPTSSNLQNDSSKISKSSNQQQQQDPSDDQQKTIEDIENDKPFVSTTTVEQQIDFVSSVQMKLTEQIENQLEEWYTNLDQHTNDQQEAEQLWSHLEYQTQPYVFELCEQLRLLLEPTQRSKYSGDYRTGKRLNMKRIISYIASDFRKDRIWLRRVKPSKRQYQVILAIDDSQSMDNLQVKRLALESLILLGQTLNLLDIGQFGIVSFGEYIRNLQSLNESFNHENGIRVLQQLKFNQTKTLLAELMESVTSTFAKEKLPISNPLSQLLIILSDGRGLTVSGKDRLLKSVRHAMSQNIFVVFVILDNLSQQKSTSIFQINEAIFNGDKVEFRSYLDSFPFPYYLVIQNLEMLPRALIDVLRQFLELTTTNNNNNNQ